MNTKKERIDIINIELAVIIILIIVFGTSFFINLNNRLALNNQRHFWSRSRTFNLSITLRWLVIIAALTSLYVANKNKDLIQRKDIYNKRDLETANIQILETSLTVIVALISLYVVSRRGENTELFEEII